MLHRARVVARVTTLLVVVNVALAAPSFAASSAALPPAPEARGDDAGQFFGPSWIVGDSGDSEDQVPASVSSAWPRGEIANLPGGDAALSYLLGETASEVAAEDIPRIMLRLYEKAAERCEALPWAVLAGMGKVASDHGRDLDSRADRVRGPLQWERLSLWREFATDGDGNDEVRRAYAADAIHTAAEYLCDAIAQEDAEDDAGGDGDADAADSTAPDSKAATDAPVAARRDGGRSQTSQRARGAESGTQAAASATEGGPDAAGEDAALPEDAANLDGLRGALEDFSRDRGFADRVLAEAVAYVEPVSTVTDDLAASATTAVPSQETEIGAAEPTAAEPNRDVPTGDIEALLSNPNLRMYKASRDDIRNGLIDGRVIGLLAALTRNHTVDVVVLKSGHSRYIAGTTKESHHYHGRAVDITHIDGEPVSKTSSKAYALALWLDALPSSLRPAEVGSPFANLEARPGFFTDHMHQHHLHVGWAAR